MFSFDLFAQNLNNKIQPDTLKTNVDGGVIPEIIIHGRQKRSGIKGLSTSVIRLDIDKTQDLPRFMGEHNLMKVIQLLPGITTSSNGNTSINIRGGDAGHTLIMLNDAPVYQTSHLIGLFSIFNADHLSSMQIHKSDIPLSSRNALSSLIQFQTTDSLVHKFTLRGNVGIIASQLTMGIPISPNISLYTSGRISYFNLLLRPLLNKQIFKTRKDSIDFNKKQDFKYDFYDFNSTVIWQPNESNKVILNCYNGHDYLHFYRNKYALNASFGWSNTLASVEWNCKITDFLKAKTSLYFSNYDVSSLAYQNAFFLKLNSSIQEWGNNFFLYYEKSSLKIEAGIKGIFQNVKAFEVIPQNELFNLDSKQQVLLRTRQILLSLSSNYAISNIFSINGGILLNIYKGISPTFDWKLAFLISPSKKWNISLFIASRSQFLNLLRLSNIGFPIDCWIPSSKQIPIQQAMHYGASFYKSIPSIGCELLIDIYLRTMHNLTEYQGAIFDHLTQSINLFDRIAFGKGKSWGIEFLFKKDYGKITGWISYSFSRALRQFNSINKGKIFPSLHDRPHDLRFILFYHLNKKISLSGCWVFASGSPYTTPTSIYGMSGNIVKTYGNYNAARLPNYHRLDLSVSWKLKSRKRYNSMLNFSLHNVYARENPIYTFWGLEKNELDNGSFIISEKKQSLYTLIPSISYIFNF